MGKMVMTHGNSWDFVGFLLAKLLNITPTTMINDTYNSSSWWLQTRNITGWPHIVDHLGDLMEFNQTIYEYF
jgi:hypothetical protein